jgi:hypothetical protein
VNLKQILLGGAIGGALPTLAKVASTFVTIPSTPLPELGLLYGIVLFSIIGAAIAYATGQSDVRQALIAGIAAPGIITNLLAGATPGVPPNHNPVTGVKGAIFEIVTSASAQTPTDRSATVTGTRKVVVDPKVSGGMPSSTNIPVTVEVMGQNNQMRTVEVGTIHSLASPTTFTIPNNIDQLKIGGKAIPLTGDLTTIQLDVTTSSTSGSDFLWALGGVRNFKIDAVSPKINEGPR